MSYLTTVLADNPIHYWRMADGGGRLAHDIGSGTPLVLGCTVAESLPYTGIALDGGSVVAVGGRVRSPGGGVRLAAGAFSMEAWCFLADDIAGVANQNVLDLTNDTNGAVFRLWCQGDGKCGVAVVGFMQQLSAILPFSTWHHLVMTWDNVSYRGYVDAVNLGVTAGGATPAQNLRTDVGTNNSGGEPAYGAIAEVAVYPTALTPARITAHYLAIEVAPTQPPIYVPGGSVGVGIAGVGPYTSLLSAIWNAVHKTY